MKKNEKRRILILLIILLIVTSIFIVNKKTKDESKNEEKNNTEEFVQILEDGTKLNKSSKLKEIRNVDLFKIENIQLKSKGNQSVLLAKVTNTSENTTEEKSVNVVFLDKNENEIVSVEGIIKSLKPGESTQLNISMTLDYANVYDLRIAVE